MLDFLNIEKGVGFVCKCFASLCCGYHVAMTIPNVQAIILNPPNPYIHRISTCKSPCALLEITRRMVGNDCTAYSVVLVDEICFANILSRGLLT